MKLRYSLLLLAAVTVVSQAADPLAPTVLFKSVPPPPANAQTAGQWQKNLKILAPEVVAVETRIAAEKKRIEAAALQSASAAMPPDMARAASDPAYAQELQKKMERMTPQEKMAFAMQMQASTQNDALAAVKDPQAVLAAIDAYNTYIQTTQMASSLVIELGKRTEAITAKFDAQQQNTAKKLKYCDVGCTDDAGVDANNRAVWAEKRTIADAELKAWAALFSEWQASRTATIAKAERDLAATGYGALSKSGTNRGTLNAYYGAMLSEVELLLSITRDAAERAAAVDRGAKANAAAGVVY
ncbi:MAG: hypothetical protein M3O62_03290 [Pseudomonadota bacterium]|nr:hypothetical protein [Pseudomonadota bacterium]